MSLKPFWNEQCKALAHALDTGEATLVELPQTDAAEPTQTSGVATSPCQEAGCLEPARGRLCDAHRDIAQTDSCYVILRVGKRKGERCGTRAKGDGLCGRHAPKLTAPSNVAIHSRMIKLYPTPAQRGMLKQWFGVARKTYNTTVCIFRGKRRVKKSLAEARIHVERRLYKKKYVAATPLQIRDNAIGDCVVATVAAIKRYQKTGRAASLCFRSRKDESQSIKPYTRSCKALLDGNNRPRLFQMYASYMKPIRTKEDIPAFRACQVVMKYGREFYLKADVEYEKPPAPQSVDVRRAVGLDPNVKNLFGVWSASEQRVIDLPDFAKHNKRVARLNQVLSAIKQRRAKRTLTRKRQRTFQKRLGLRDHHHWSLINDLLSRYDVVCLPPFEAHRKAHGLGSGTNESMFSIAHGLLLARLTYKAESQGKCVLSRGEEYTTKTCSRCGALNSPDDRAFACARCGLAMHRDLNSAKNILVKSLLQL